jgi:23S rRNA pseudouridine1911/1915/1917 synthase
MADASFPRSPEIRVLYEDNHVIAVVKPPGIPSQEDESGAADMLTLIKADLKERHNKPGNVFLGLVHRLDRPVGGVMVFAKTSKAASRLSESVRSRSFDKCYIAVVNGVPADAAGTLRHYLRKDSKTNTVKAFASPQPDTKEAVLDYAVIASSGGKCLIAVKLYTGRPHQIRVQMAAVGCPLAGDRKYGTPGRTDDPENPALWSASIGVAHPVTKEWIVFTAEPPAEPPWTKWPGDRLTAAAVRFRD